MVKGISRQVIVVHSPDPKLFEQAIFILKDDALESGGVTEELLMKEANRLISGAAPSRRRNGFCAPMWTIFGAAMTGVAWIISTLL